ncbi:MAG: hybrid sensor histidine kinase/response regulator [Elusimicrobia bacterium]|nr:hybrid sensor histidine kinase/response regulator [Elusimicrobiota bacterium]
MTEPKGRILIVDDDAHLRDSLRDNLELDGYEVDEAGTGAEALAAAAKGFDVILMDFNLPDATGIDVIHSIRKTDTDSQILMLTAHASLDAALRAIQEAVYDFLTKPVDFDHLKRAIAKALDKQRVERENRRLIKELKAANDEAKRANDKLLNLSNMKSKFMSMSSHDLSNALMTLQVSYEMLEQSITPTPEQAKRMQYIGGSITQIARLVEDLVDWAAIEQGKLRLERAEFAPGKLVEDAVVGPQSKAAQRGLELKVELEPSLPAVVGDKKRISQVLHNLLENALRHTQRGGTVTVFVSKSGGEVRFAVKDTGEGIAPTELSKIFESFYQTAANGGAERGRLGLGLSISREIVAMHGGRIWVESEGKGKGATFIFTVPLPAPAKA